MNAPESALAIQRIGARLAARQLDFPAIAASDAEFLFQVYASTREEELAVTSFSDEQKVAFLRQQFGAQHHHYQLHYAGSAFALIRKAEEPVGRLYLAVLAREIRVIDIAILPQHRGRGLGAAVLGAVLEEGALRGCPVRIHVERFNRALSLYQRLGFRQIADEGVYYLMEKPFDAGQTAEPGLHPTPA